MYRLFNLRPRLGLLPILLLMLTAGWSTSASAITTEEFLLLDNTLLLNAGLFPSGGTISVRSDFGREQISALGVRRDLGREMIRMGREFSLYLRGRATSRRSYNQLFLREARTLSLRSDARQRLSLLSVRKARQLLRGRYLLGARQTAGGRETLFANFVILDDSLIWTVTNKAGDQVFVMSNYKNVPEAGGLLLLISGLIGLALVMFYRPRAQRQLASRP